MEWRGGVAGGVTGCLFVSFQVLRLFRLVCVLFGLCFVWFVFCLLMNE